MRRLGYAYRCRYYRSRWSSAMIMTFQKTHMDHKSARRHFPASPTASNTSANTKARVSTVKPARGLKTRFTLIFIFRPDRFPTGRDNSPATARHDTLDRRAWHLEYFRQSPIPNTILVQRADEIDFVIGEFRSPVRLPHAGAVLTNRNYDPIFHNVEFFIMRNMQ